jgi:hypothetical protein
MKHVFVLHGKTYCCVVLCNMHPQAQVLTNAMHGICLCNSMYGQGFFGLYAMVSMNIVLCMDIDYYLSLKRIINYSIWIWES